MAKTYEYKRIEVRGDGMIQALNAEGAQGWHYLTRAKVFRGTMELVDIFAIFLERETEKTEKVEKVKITKPKVEKAKSVKKVKAPRASVEVQTSIVE